MFREFLESIIGKQARYSYIGRRTKKVFEWKPFIKLKDWFEENIVLVKGARKGKFQSKYMPHSIEIFEDLDKPEVTVVTLKSASQIIKTTIALGFIMKQIDTDPDDCMIMIPRSNDLKLYSENKLKPSIDGCPAVQQKLMDYKTLEKTRDNSYIYRFAGGLLNLISSNNTKTISIKYAVFDEVAEFMKGKVGEALERMKSYAEAGWKALIVSTQVSLDDEINYYFNGSEVKKQYFMYCQHCEGYYYPDNTHLKFPSQKDFTESMKLGRDLYEYEIIGDYMPFAKRSPYLECPHCKGKTTDDMRKKAILEGKLKWFQVVAVRDEETDEISYEVAEKQKKHYTTVGFDVNTLCVASVHLSQFVEKTIQAGNSYIQLDFFYKGYYNKIYTRKVEKVEQSDMLLLGNGLKEWVVPRGAVAIYMGVDNQKDHYWYEVKAYCYGSISHTIKWGRVESEQELARIWEYGQDLKDEDGEFHMISKMGIDRRGYNEGSFNRTDDVDRFVDAMVREWKNGDENRIYATEGEPHLPARQAYAWKKTKDDSSHTIKYDIKTIKISNLYVKNQVQGNITDTIKLRKLKEDEEVPLECTRGLFFINQDTIDAESKETVSTSYIRQLTAEVFDYGKSSSGKLNSEKSWINTKQRDNHLFDTSVICETFAIMDKIYLEEKPSEEQVDLSGIISSY